MVTRWPESHPGRRCTVVSRWNASLKASSPLRNPPGAPLCTLSVIVYRNCNYFIKKRNCYLRINQFQITCELCKWWMYNKLWSGIVKCILSVYKRCYHRMKQLLMTRKVMKMRGSLADKYCMILSSIFCMYSNRSSGEYHLVLWKELLNCYLFTSVFSVSLFCHDAYVWRVCVCWYVPSSAWYAVCCMSWHLQLCFVGCFLNGYCPSCHWPTLEYSDCLEWD